jgi:hypothetical protein
MPDFSEYQLEYQRPWDIPLEVFWDKSEGANIRRGQWALDHCAGVTLEEIAYGLVMQPEDLQALQQASAAE